MEDPNTTKQSQPTEAPAQVAFSLPAWPGVELRVPQGMEREQVIDAMSALLNELAQSALSRVRELEEQQHGTHDAHATS